MKACLLQISGYRQLYQDVENVRKKPYDADNLQHEKLLLQVSQSSPASAVLAGWAGAETRVQGDRSVHILKFFTPSRISFLG